MDRITKSERVAHFIGGNVPLVATVGFLGALTGALTAPNPGAGLIGGFAISMYTLFVGYMICATND